MRTVYMIAVITLSFASSAMAEGWNFNFRGRYLPPIDSTPAAATAEASSTIDGPAVEAAPIEAAPIQKDAGYANGHNGCNCHGNGGYFNQSWFGGCCEQQNSCCAGIWDNYCSQRKSWCHGHHHHKARCCQAAPTCAPACNTGCGHRGAWMNAGYFHHHYSKMMNFGGFGCGNGCSNCGEAGEVYGKAIEGAEVETAPAPMAEPAPMPTPAPKPELKPVPNPPKPMAREARGFYFPTIRMTPIAFGL